MRLPIWGIFTVMMIALHPVPGRSNTGLPHEFDSLVPVFAAAHHISTRYTRESVTVKFATREAFKHVAVFYKEALNKKGWRISTPDNGKRFAAAKDRIKLNLTENYDPQGFMIHLYYPGGRE